jgi:hypothetical protein
MHKTYSGVLWQTVTPQFLIQSAIFEAFAFAVSGMLGYLVIYHWDALARKARWN